MLFMKFSTTQFYISSHYIPCHVCEWVLGVTSFDIQPTEEYYT